MEGGDEQGGEDETAKAIREFIYTLVNSTRKQLEDGNMKGSEPG